MSATMIENYRTVDKVLGLIEAKGRILTHEIAPIVGDVHIRSCQRVLVSMEDADMIMRLKGVGGELWWVIA